MTTTTAHLDAAREHAAALQRYLTLAYAHSDPIEALILMRLLTTSRELVRDVEALILARNALQRAAT